MTDSDQTLPPAEADAEAVASAESVQEIYAALAPEALDRDVAPPADDAVGAEVLARQVVHVLLVAHDGEAWLPRALAALGEVDVPLASVTAVDTGSRDSTARLLADSGTVTNLQTLPRDTGFPAAVATAAALVPTSGSVTDDVTEWFWLLHDDCAPHADSLRRLLSAAITHDAAVVGPKVLDFDGRRHLVELGLTITGAGRRYTGLEGDERDQGQHDDRRDVLAVGTAGMLVRRDAWDSLGGLDPQIDVFRDDVDFGWRARLADYRVVVEPSAVVEHAAAATRGRRRLSSTRDRGPLVDRRNAVHVMLANASRWALVPVMVRIVVGSLLRSIGFVIGKVPGVAYDEAVAVAGALRPGRLRQARRWRRPMPRTGSVAGLRPSLGTQLRGGVDSAASVLAGTGAGQDVPSARRRSLAPQPLGGDELDDVPVADGWLTRVSWWPGFLLVAVTGLLTLVSVRTVLIGGRLSGGALLPAPDRASQWWSSYLASWHPVGLGSGVDAPAWLAVLAGASVPVLGSGSALVSIALLGSVPLSVGSAWLATRGLATTVPVRVWAAATYGVLLLSTGAVAAGRVGTAFTAVLLPVLVRAVVEALRPGAPLRRAWWAALLLAVVTAMTPVVWPVAAVAGAVGAVAFTRSAATALRWLVVSVTPAALLAPWMPALAQRPELLVMEPGLTGRGAELSDPALPAWAPVLLSSGGPGSLATGALAGVLVVAGAAVLLSRRRMVHVGWVLGLSGMAAGVATSRVGVSSPLGEGSAAGWPGPAVLMAGAGLLVATTAAAAGVDWRGRRIATAVLALVALSTTGVVGAVGLVGSTADPLTRSGIELLPAYVAEEANGGDRIRTLVLRSDATADPATLEYTLVRDRSPRLGDAALVDPTGSELLADVVADLVAGRGAASAAELATFAVRYVFVPDVDDVDLVESLDGQAGLVRASAPDGGAIWRVDGTTARVRLLTPGESSEQPVGDVVPSQETAVSATLASPAARQVVLAELDDPGWTATLDGEELTRRQHAGGLVAFDLPRGSGDLRVEHEAPERRWLLVVQGAAVALVLVLMVPSLGGRRESVEESLL